MIAYIWLALAVWWLIDAARTLYKGNRLESEIIANRAFICLVLAVMYNLA